MLSWLTISFCLVWVNELLIEVDRVFSMLDKFIFVNILSNLLGNLTIVFSSDILFLIGYIDPSISIFLEGFLLFSLPDLYEALDCLKGKLLLLNG